MFKRATLNLVDLAGSERWGTGNMGAGRVKEMTSINQSLSALSNCISALTEEGRPHVPYRDSLLTRLLQGSLGGNSKTYLVVTVAPGLASIDESIR